MKEEEQRMKEGFTQFMLDSGALLFKESKLKSGRISPFFMNLGIFNSGEQLFKLAEFYAEAIINRYGTDFNVVFGPAYKGIPLSVAVTMVLEANYGLNVQYCSNRKEVKDHGEGGALIGAKLKDGDRIVIVEDVTTSGKSMEETVPILRSQGAKIEIVGSMVSLDRHEVGNGGEKTALEEITDLYGFPASAIVSMPEVIDYMNSKQLLGTKTLVALGEYYQKYGPKEE